jgi:two-component system nitrate/nitrite response regulator NarL
MDDNRVLIVADDPLARAGLAALLADREGCAIVGQIAAEGELFGEFAREVDVYRPDALIWDLGWEVNPDGLPAFDDLDLPVIALLPEPDLAGDVGAAGARGVLLRNASPERLIAALAAVIAGLVVIDPALAPALTRARAGSRPELPSADLTPRELDVLRLLAEGLSNRAIALHLDISEHTVKFHLNAILDKLTAQSRTEAVVTAIRLGLITV